MGEGLFHTRTPPIHPLWRGGEPPIHFDPQHDIFENIKSYEGVNLYILVGYIHIYKMPKKNISKEVAVSVDSIAPGLYDDDNEGTEDVVDDLQYDTYNLVACDDHALNFAGGLNSAMQAAAQRGVQLVINRLFTCPTESTELGPVANLPAQTMRFPREKRVPEPRAETVWEKFAREKGIKNKKRDRMVYDEVEQEYRPRYGYKGANSRIENHAIVEVKEGQDPMEDPWAAARQEKKRRVEKNTLQRVRNIDRAAGRPSKKNKTIDTYGNLHEA